MQSADRQQHTNRLPFVVPLLPAVAGNALVDQRGALVCSSNGSASIEQLQNDNTFGGRVPFRAFVLQPEVFVRVDRERLQRNRSESLRRSARNSA
jgi:hypothetical protein